MFSYESCMRYIFPTSRVSRRKHLSLHLPFWRNPLPANHIFPSPEWLIPSSTVISSSLCTRGCASSNKFSCETPVGVKSLSIIPAFAYQCPSCQIQSSAFMAAAMMSRVSLVGCAVFADQITVVRLIDGKRRGLDEYC